MPEPEFFIGSSDFNTFLASLDSVGRADCNLFHTFFRYRFCCRLRAAELELSSFCCSVLTDEIAPHFYFRGSFHSVVSTVSGIAFHCLRTSPVRFDPSNSKVSLFQFQIVYAVANSTLSRSDRTPSVKQTVIYISFQGCFRGKSLIFFFIADLVGFALVGDSSIQNHANFGSPSFWNVIRSATLILKSVRGRLSEETSSGWDSESLFIPEASRVRFRGQDP